MLCFHRFTHLQFFLDHLQVTLYSWTMRKQLTTTSYSMLRSLHQRLHQRLPMHGDKSKLVSRLIELWLDNKIPQVSLHGLRSRSVVQSNTSSNETNWQTP